MGNGAFFFGCPIPDTFVVHSQSRWDSVLYSTAYSFYPSPPNARYYSCNVAEEGSFVELFLTAVSFANFESDSKSRDEKISSCAIDSGELQAPQYQYHNSEIRLNLGTQTNTGSLCQDSPLQMYLFTWVIKGRYFLWDIPDRLICTDICICLVPLMLLLLYAWFLWLVRRKYVRSHLKQHSWQGALGLLHFNLSETSSGETARGATGKNYPFESWCWFICKSCLNQVMYKAMAVLINWLEAD